jgi:undecaprenyl-diphosphatase
MLSFLFPLFYKRKNWLLLLLFTVGLVVVFSRIYLGVHYLSDVAAGASFGILIGSLIYYFLFRKIFFKKEEIL